MLDSQLSPIDSLFLHIERPNTPMHIAGVVTFAGSSEFQEVYEMIESRLHLVPRFTQRIMPVPFGLGLPFWADDPDFDLSYHLRHAALPQPGTDEQLCEFASRLLSRPLDRSKPLWELYVIDGLKGDRSAIVSKTHHAMIDGLASMDLATVLLDFSPEVQRVTPPRKKRVTRLPSGAELVQASLAIQARDVMDVGKAVRTAASAPGKLFEVAKESLDAVTTTASSLIRPAKPSVLNSGPGLHRRFAMVRSTLQTFKDVKDGAGATVNDVILSVCADALGRLFRRRGEPTEGKSLRVMVPVSIRTEGDKGTLGNEVTSMFPDLPIGKMKPLDRLQLISAQMLEIKESGQAVGAELLVNLTRWAPPNLHAAAARLGARARLMNTVISNVPGPQIPLYSCGQQMQEPYAVIPLSQGQTLAIGVTSYNGGIFFGLNADRETHPDLQRLASFIRDSISELETAIGDLDREVTHADTVVSVGN